MGSPRPPDGSFETAPAGRARAIASSSFGDLGDPVLGTGSASGNQWFQSCDNAWYAVSAIENQATAPGRLCSIS